MDDGGAGIYQDFAREEAADRRRTRVAAAVALVVHLVLLVTPWPGADEGLAVALPPSRGEAFELRPLRLAPPEPPAPTPLPTTEPVDHGPPAEATAEVLAPEGIAQMLVPPQPVVTPPPKTPAALWGRGLGAEVLLTLVVDARGEVAEVTVEEVRLLRPGAAGAGEEEAAVDGEAVPVGPGAATAAGAGPEPTGDDGEAETPEVSAGELARYGEVAAGTARHWLFLPATLAGNPLSVAVGVVITFPAPAAVPAPAAAAVPEPPV